jgi:hypothetical protein
MTLLATVVIMCWVLGGLVLTRPRANLSGEGLAFWQGLVGALLVATGFWLALLLAYLVGTR